MPRGKIYDCDVLHVNYLTMFFVWSQVLIIFYAFSKKKNAEKENFLKEFKNRENRQIKQTVYIRLNNIIYICNFISINNYKR